MKNTYRQSFGQQGELVAKRYLLDQGFELLDCNFRFSNIAEIDIIAHKDLDWVFVEVKTRTNNQFGAPQQSVNKTKLKKIQRAAKFYLQKRFKWESIYWRIDIIEVYYKNKKWYVNHIPNIQ